jgi:hypothetical protein
VFEDVHSLCSKCAQGLVYVLKDVHSLCSRIGICAQGCGYMCSGMCIVCVQSVNGVLKVVNVCSRMCICVRGCDRCSKV